MSNKAPIGFWRLRQGKKKWSWLGGKPAPGLGDERRRYLCIRHGADGEGN